MQAMHRTPASTQSSRAACRRPELLLLGALLHDIGKGLPADHSDVGATIASQVARRIGLDSEGREIVTWLVRNHLLMAEIATRRDLSDASVADNLAAACAGDAERLRLLYLLTIGDSRATGPAAWGATKGVLLRDLFVKAATAIERGEAAAIAEDRRELLDRPPRRGPGCCVRGADAAGVPPRVPDRGDRRTRGAARGRERERRDAGPRRGDPVPPRARSRGRHRARP